MALAKSRPGLSHVSLGVCDIVRSKAFYSATLSWLGLCLIYDNTSDTSSSQRTLGFGTSPEGEEILNVFEVGAEAQPPGPGFHIALHAANPDAVTAFYEAALANGGVSEGEPGYRTNYGDNHFAAFVRDPDGWKLEAVWQPAAIRHEK